MKTLYTRLLETPFLKVCAILAAASILLSLQAAAAATIPVTGQTTSYANGDDGNLQEGVSWPSPRFLDNGDGTVTDMLTGLVWLKNANCNGLLSWSAAISAAADLASGECGLFDGSTFEDWRLPNVRELESLVHLGVFSPALPNTSGLGQATDNNPFIDLQSNEYWSSTSNPRNPALAFSISFVGGQRVVSPKSDTRLTLYVRNGSAGEASAQPLATGQTLCYNGIGTVIPCGNSGQDGESQEGAAWPVPRFTDMGNGTVYDNLTQLTWLKNANCYGFMNWSTAVSRARNLSVGSCGLSDGSLAGDWRLANRNELSSLIDFGNHSPALADSAGTGSWSPGDPFTGVEPTSGYWTGTTVAQATGMAWFVELERGLTGSEGKQSIAYFWPVRGELKRTLTVAIDGPGTAGVTSTPAGISCPGTCSNDFEKDSIVTLTAHPAAGARFQGWSQTDCGSNLSCAVSMSTAKTITAKFVEGGSSIAAWQLLLMD